MCSVLTHLWRFSLQRPKLHVFQQFLTALSSKTTDPTTPFSFQEVIYTLKSSPTREAAGLDGLKGEYLRLLPKAGFKFFHFLFNDLYANSNFSSQWKQTCIIVTPKPGTDLSLPSSYRPISLLSQLAKAHEGLLLTQLEAECDRLKVLSDFQFGFQGEHSTVQQLIGLSDFCLDAANEKHPTIILK